MPVSIQPYRKLLPNERLLPLRTKGVLQEYAIVDADLYEHLSQFPWWLAKTYNKSGRYPTGWVPKFKTIGLHRYVYFLKFKILSDSTNQIDHKDKCRLNAVVSNLRIVTNSFNIANSKRRLDNTSGYRGVQRRTDLKGRPDGKPFRAYISKDNKRIWLGRFLTAEEAALRVNQAFRELFPGVDVPNPEVDTK